MTKIMTPALTDAQRSALTELISLPQYFGREIETAEDPDATCASVYGSNEISDCMLLGDVCDVLWPNDDCPDPPEIAAGHEWHD